ncbi:hypothetical protein JHK87_035097 [Glycine soja]|nr:hypothetical protein JHK87_035097 [Glycine soja]
MESRKKLKNCKNGGVSPGVLKHTPPELKNTKFTAAGQLAHFPILKGVQDLKVPAKEQKNINGSAKKAEVIDQAMLFKGKGGNFDEAETE